jgi:hypothetical protein
MSTIASSNGVVPAISATKAQLISSARYSFFVIRTIVRQIHTILHISLHKFSYGPARFTKKFFFVIYFKILNIFLKSFVEFLSKKKVAARLYGHPVCECVFLPYLCPRKRRIVADCASFLPSIVSTGHWLSGVSATKKREYLFAYSLHQQQSSSGEEKCVVTHFIRLKSF